MNWEWDGPFIGSGGGEYWKGSGDKEGAGKDNHMFAQVKQSGFKTEFTALIFWPSDHPRGGSREFTGSIRTIEETIHHVENASWQELLDESQPRRSPWGTR